ncbi:tol-pal system YbgF family protein [Novosphingobium sp. B1]|uniref:tetratricopeptide repeat protein n=1 Tax=Novosphingobium sp. B1 TaxID=1938756 RepID=UPI0009D7F878|nr:tetratricopeptide repeat protein [Novosphingobium sp. B1]SMC80628.1 TolA-binding protein [Novosphingobium sp. B1]
MTFELRRCLPLLALAAVSAAPLGAPALAQSAANAPTDAEPRLRRIEAEIRAIQRKVFPDGAGKTFAPEITPSQTTTTPRIGTPASSAVTDVLARMDAVEAQMARLTAQVEEGQNRAAKIEERLARLEAQAVPSEPAAAPTPAAAPVVTTQPAPKPTTAASTTTTTAPKPATTPAAKPAAPSAARVAAVQAIEKPSTADAGLDEYNYGYRLWEAKFFPEAQQQLQIYVDRYPKHSQISFGRNLLGRAWLDDGKPGTAAQFFLQNYLADKKGARAPDSLLFLGIAMVKLKDTEKACGAFAELAATYPDEIAGRLKGQYDAARTSVKCK